MRIVLAAVVMLAVTVGLAVAQGQPPQERIDAALARARQVGTPVLLLESKVAEGKAKGVSLERIAAAVERRQAALERASQVMTRGNRNGDGELAVAADAIESGVGDAVLKVVSETAPPDRRAVAIAALTQLVQLGHVPEAALARVQDALKRGPEALLNLPAEAGRRGGPPATSPASDRGAGRGQAGGPPSSVPAPGGATQPTNPDPPASRGRGTPDSPDASAGRGNPGPPEASPGRGNPGPPEASPGRGNPGPPEASPGRGNPGPPEASPGRGNPDPPDGSRGRPTGPGDGRGRGR